MSPELLKVADRAGKDPDARLYSLARLVDPDALGRAFARIRKGAAAGVDGVTKEQYEQNLEVNLQKLHERLKSGRYRHQPIRRVHIPKAPGKTRPIGISSIEDKIVHGALTEVLGAIYEQDFVEGSYGFRPDRSAHDALRAVDAMASREGMCDGDARPAHGRLRARVASRQDTSGAVRSSRPERARRQRTVDLRLSGIHAVLA